MVFNKRFIASVMALMIFMTSLPLHVFADTEANTESTEEDANPYTIKNKYMTYTINPKTGGFSVVTAEGHPEKPKDNEIPLLYQDDIEKSVETSYTTIRIDGRDYIFGRDYSYYGIETKLSTPEKFDNGRQIRVVWTLGDYEVTQLAAVSYDENTATTGNIAIKYEVKNNGSSSDKVGIRVLFDTAIDKYIDAPFIFVDNSYNPIINETELTGSKIPDQLRLTNRMGNIGSSGNITSSAYFIFDDRIFEDPLKPDKIILGHWSNIANTRYEYTPNTFESFMSIGGNNQLTSDSSVALYWDEAPLAPGQIKYADILYGVGAFTDIADGSDIGVNVNILDPVELSEDGKTYVDEGKFILAVDIDNTVNTSQTLGEVTLILQLEEGLDSEEAEKVPLGGDEEDEDEDEEDEDKEDDEDEEVEMINRIVDGVSTIAPNNIERFTFEITAEEVELITAKAITIRVQTSTVSGTTKLKDINVATTKYILLPGTNTGKSLVDMNAIYPEIVYYSGSKFLTVLGDVTGLAAIRGSEEWDLYLIHETTGKEELVPKKDINFIDKEYSGLTITLNNPAIDELHEMEAGDYYLEFRFEGQLAEEHGEILRSGTTFEVSTDEKYKSRYYNMLVVALIDSAKHLEETYKHAVLPFNSEGEFNTFLEEYYESDEDVEDWKYPKKLDTKGVLVQPKEIYLVLRGNFRETGAETHKFVANRSEAPITINNIVSYTDSSDVVLDVGTGDDDIVFSGEGELTNINSTTFWDGWTGWKLTFEQDKTYVMDKEKIDANSSSNVLELLPDWANYPIANIAGFAFDFQYGVFTKDIGKTHILNDGYDDYEGKDIYGISFGGQVELPIKNIISAPKPTETTGEQTKPKEEKPKPEVEKTETLDDGTVKNYYPKTTTTFEGVGQDTKKGSVLSDKLLAVDINDVRFGQDINKPDDLGFVGIDVTASVGLPDDVFGSLVRTTGFGFNATVVINTIEHFYSLAVSIDLLKLFATNFQLALKGVETESGAFWIHPDIIKFAYENRVIDPTEAATLGAFGVLGLSGGIENISSYVTSGYLEEIPTAEYSLGVALALVSFLRLDVTGEGSETKAVIEGKISNRFTQVVDTITPPTGSATNPTTSTETVKGGFTGTVKVGIDWKDDIKWSVYAQVDILNVIVGTVQITVKNSDYYLSGKVGIRVPYYIPIIGDIKLTEVEVAGSREFIGANVKIAGLGVGVKYIISSGDIDFNTTGGVDLSPPEGLDAVTKAEFGKPYRYVDENGQEVFMTFGTNVVELASSVDADGMINFANTVNQKSEIDLKWGGFGEPSKPDNIMITVPYTYSGQANKDMFTVTGPNGVLDLEPSVINGELQNKDGSGNFILQELPEGKFMYFSVPNATDAHEGTWTVTTTTEGLSLGAMEALDFKDLAEIKTVNYTYDSNDGFKLPVEWTASAEATKDSQVALFLTEANNLEDAKASLEADDDRSHMLGMYDISEDAINGTIDVELDKNLREGTYYVMATYFSGSGGPSYTISDSSFEFTNPNLPTGIDAGSLIYSSNGRMFVNIADETKDDYTHYEVRLFGKNDDGNFTVDLSDKASDIYMKDFPRFYTDYTGEGKGLQFELRPASALDTGEEYVAHITTIREELTDPATGATMRYRSSYTYETEPFEFPEFDPPVLEKIDISIEDEILNNKPVTDDMMEITYYFDRPVYLNATIGGATYNSISYAETLTIQHDIRDGDLLGSFVAYGINGDYVSSEDYPDITGATIAVKVDNTVPILSLNQIELASGNAEDSDEDLSVFVAENIFYADADGNYTIDGLTEPGAILSGNGEVYEDYDIDYNGTFVINGQIKDGYGIENIDLTATDYAGNTSTIAITVIREDFTDVESLKIYRKVVDGEGYSLQAIETYAEQNIEGMKDNTQSYLEIPFGTDLEFVVKGVTSRGAEMTIPDSQISWDTVYEYNHLSYDGTTFTTQTVGETALVARLIEGMSLASTGEITRYAKEDYVIINITETDKSELKEAIDAAERELFDDGNATASETATFKALVEAANALFDNFEADVDDVIAMTAELIEATAIYIEAKNRVVTDPDRPGGNGGSGSSGGSDEPDGITNPFMDVSPSDWFYEAVMSMLEKEIMLGTSETTFSPYITSSRAMLVVMLHRLAGELKVDSDVEFTDILPDMWYSEAVAWIVSEGIMLGYGEGIFGIEDDITREQLVTILWRYLDEPMVADQAGMAKFKDLVEISDYAVEAMKWAYSEGLIQGRSATELAPKGNANRAEIATIFDRFVVKHIEEYME